MSEINTLVLHKIAKKSAKNFEDISIETFEKIIDLSRNNTKTISDAFDSKNLNKKSICLTFDDGYLSDVDVVLPRLLKNKMKATFFIVPSYLDKEGHLSGEQVIKLSKNGMEIGSHSFSHLDFTKIKPSSISNELSSSKKFLEDLIGKEVRSFSFPYGFTSKDSIRAVFDAGYSYCCTSKHGLSKKNSKIISRNSINIKTKDSRLKEIVYPSKKIKLYWILEDLGKPILKKLPSRFYLQIRSLLSKI